MASIWVVVFHATNAVGEQLDVGPFSFSTEAKAEQFVYDTVNPEMERRIAQLDEWQQQDVMRDEPTLAHMMERYFQVVDEQGESSLTWTIDVDIVDLGDMREARKLFEFI